MLDIRFTDLEGKEEEFLATTTREAITRLFGYGQAYQVKDHTAADGSIRSTLTLDGVRVGEFAVRVI